MNFKYGLNNNNICLIIDNEDTLQWYISNIILADHEKSVINVLLKNTQPKFISNNINKFTIVDEIVSAKLKIVTSIFNKYKQVIINSKTGMCTPIEFESEFQSDKYLI